MVDIALIGVGTIGNAMAEWVRRNNPSVRMHLSDPAKGFDDDVYGSPMDAYFIAINVPNGPDGRQVTKELVEICGKIRHASPSAPIWVRSTITPSTLRGLDYHFGVNYMPEFLSERSAVEDFATLPIVYTPTDKPKHLELLKMIFRNRPGIEMTSTEAVFAKYFHNLYGAAKVTFFNCVKELCDENGVSFDKVKDGIFSPSHMTSRYTEVPGPDGKFGYGGKCFPKDAVAFLTEFKDSGIGTLLGNMQMLNDRFRSKT